MAFSSSYISSFYKEADQVLNSYVTDEKDGLFLGEYTTSSCSPKAIIEIMNIWVERIDKLLALVEHTEGRSPKYISLYAERGITFDEFYYLFSSHITEEEYLQTPAFLFTKTFSKDLRDRQFHGWEYSEKSYVDFILSLHVIPTQFFNSHRVCHLPIHAMYAHSYCVAKTRSGKTELLKTIIYHLILARPPKTSLLILDPHGEFAREIRRLKVVHGSLEDFIYLDPAIDNEHSPVFNPFQISDKSVAGLAYTTDTILDAFQQLLKDQTVTGNMRRLLRHCIFALLYHDDTTMMDMLTLLQGISRNRSKKEPEFFPAEERLMELGRSATDPLTRQFFEYGWRDVDSRTVSAVVERIDGILSHPLVRRFVVGKSSFYLDQYLNSGKIVVVNLDFTKLGNIGSEAIGRLLVSEAQNISARRNLLPKRQRPRTLIFLDECQRFVSAAIERALSEFAKFNTYLFLAHQYIDQIDDGMVKAMLSNTENKIIGRNSSATMTSLSSDVGVDKDELLKVQRYQFYMKAGDRNPFLFTSSDALLDLPSSNHYITEQEARKNIDSIMIEKYYRSEHHNVLARSQNKISSSNGKTVISISEEDF